MENCEGVPPFSQTNSSLLLDEPPEKMPRGEGPKLELRFLISFKAYFSLRPNPFPLHLWPDPNALNPSLPMVLKPVPPCPAPALVPRPSIPARLSCLLMTGAPLLYSVKISISDSCGPERVLVLDGDMGSIMEILTNVLNRNNREDGVDLRLLVHQSQAGCVIGRGGYKIKELREQSNLRTLKVYQMLCPGSTDRVIQLVGEVDKVINCLQSIAELLEVFFY
ncbi:unnamed protein product [Protopolystoma xenopodis]|uniref:K Homology domain-containing protein n=1 Tax=Protopolystoma xenopodis TaxID=117903 RepID=A0A3S4ZDT5_9PLAT|nr:unnamed protein product [Protopolystoma xenopodis]